MKKLIVLFLLLLFVQILPANSSEDITNWKPWSDAIFEEAKKENKFIILDLEAVWCHWCHVMHKETYADSSVIKILNDHYISVRVDQDSRPDLSNRYRDYGWPATIIFSPDGKELAKRSGYIQAEDMKLLLQKIVENPSPEETEVDETKITFSNSPVLSEELKTKLINNHEESYDNNLGGLKLYQKFLDADSTEYSLYQAKAGNTKEEEKAKKTLDAAITTIDPVWGGAYQYSTMGGWNYPHFEKLATIQSRFIEIYSVAYNHFKDPKYLKAATDVYKYVRDFLTSPEGVFYVSQDADLIQGEHSHDYFSKSDSERRKLGIPRVDEHVYSSQNGLLIDAFVSLYKATQNENYLTESIEAANWIIKNRSLKVNVIDNLKWVFSDWTDFKLILKNIKWMISNLSWAEVGFSHDKKDSAGPFLADTLNMGKAFISLYEATSNKKWLVKAEQCMRFIDRHFTSPVAGFATSEASCKVCANRSPGRLIEENIELARLSNRLFDLTKNNSYKVLYDHSMKYLVTPEIALKTLTEPGILIVSMKEQ